MVKVKLEKGKKAPVVAVDAPKDRVKTKANKKAAAPKKVKPVPAKDFAEASDSDEAPEAIPIAKVDQVPVVSKNKNKNKKKNKKAAAAAAVAGEDDKKDNLTKINKAGKVTKKPQKKDAFVDKAEKITKKLKSAAKNLKTKDAVVEDPAEAPEMLATKDAIRAAVIALRKATEEEAKEKKKLFDKDFKYCLQVCATKIPKCPTRLVRLPLPHSLYDDTDDICLVVRDDVRGKQHDPELTAAKYEQIFREQKIDFIKKVMPFQEMKQNHSSFEQKRKLAQTYELFLCDSIISARVFKFTGKYFIETRKSAVPVKIKHNEEKNLKAELLRGVSKTCYKQVSHGMTTAIQVATHKHSVEQFVENIEAILEKLKTEYPGGWVNIKNIYLKPMAHSVVSLPLYISEIDPNRVPVPVIVGPKYRHLMKVANKLENESKKFRLNEGFKVEKKKGVKRESEDGKGQKTKKVKVENEEKEEQENDEETEVKAESDGSDGENEPEEEEKAPKVKPAKKQKKNKKSAAAAVEKKVETKPVVKKENVKKNKKGPAMEKASPKKAPVADKKPKFEKKGKKAKA
ncbi:ribosomal L1 domain-containing protein CG13096 [Culicoides brevitarsis]|uniref:ribosomal L1 domain-containing protein CG13096 n=1 Tax=Culicoides brevitarsis TaxID=469753 RepID=UPI00307C251E